jgi:phosphatidylserine/phosphatidylglycerophosphate/cardiolipin synthase-like enzyme
MIRERRRSGKGEQAPQWDPCARGAFLALNFLSALAACIAGSGSAAASSIEIHYAPREDLERIDVDVIDNAERWIDMAAYVLSDPFVIEALRDAADRGVTIRIYLDKSQYSQHGPRNGGPIGELLTFPNVFARVKGRGVLMHLKAYAVDGERLRTGSGNFSHSGLAFQDNDLILVDDPSIVAKFETNFDAIWARGTNAGALPSLERGGAR